MNPIQKALAFLQQASQSPQVQTAKRIAMPPVLSSQPLQRGQEVATFPGYQEAQARGGFDSPPQQADMGQIKALIQSFLSQFGGESTHSFRKPGYENVGQPQAVPQVQAATPQPTQAPQEDPADAEMAAKILEGYRKYSGGKPVAMEKHIPAMVQAAKQYPVFQENPMLIPATSIVETSAGENYRLNNNPLSWAARIQKAGQYSPQSEEESIRDMITAVGGDPKRGEGFDPETAKNRMRTASYYDKFRKSNDLKDFTDTYDGGNEKYLPALLKAMQYFQ